MQHLSRALSPLRTILLSFKLNLKEIVVNSSIGPLGYVPVEGRPIVLYVGRTRASDLVCGIQTPNPYLLLLSWPLSIPVFTVLFSMGGRETRSFLALPLELRELIYDEILSSPYHGPEILRVCRNVYSEARKFLYLRPIIFRSQSNLHQWLCGRSRDVLQGVLEFQLELQDVDLTPVLVSASLDSPIKGSTSLRTWDLYEKELDALDQSLQTLSNAKIITIRAPVSRHTHLYDDFLAKVLQMLGLHFTFLQELTLEGNTHNQSLGFLENLGALTAFSFDGFSASNPAETMATLSRINLNRISIVSQPTMLTPTQGRHSRFSLATPAFDGSVLCTIKQLSSVLIAERIPSPMLSALYFNSDILGSLQNHKTLSTLSFRLSQTPNEDARDALSELLRNNSSVQRLDLDWPHLDTSILNILTNRLKSLWIRASNLLMASNILRAIHKSKEEGEVQQLHRVVLIRCNWTVSNTEGEDDSENEEVRCLYAFGPLFFANNLASH